MSSGVRNVLFTQCEWRCQALVLLPRAPCHWSQTEKGKACVWKRHKCLCHLKTRSGLEPHYLSFSPTKHTHLSSFGTHWHPCQTSTHACTHPLELYWQQNSARRQTDVVLTSTNLQTRRHKGSGGKEREMREEKRRVRSASSPACGNAKTSRRDQSAALCRVHKCPKTSSSVNDLSLTFKRHS